MDNTRALADTTSLAVICHELLHAWLEEPSQDQLVGLLLHKVTCHGVIMKLREDLHPELIIVWDIKLP
jgi:hypothetical protein